MSVSGDLLVGLSSGAYLSGWFTYLAMVRINKPKLFPFLISLNGYKFTLMAATVNRGREWLEYRDDRGALLAAFPSEHFPESAPLEEETK